MSMCIDTVEACTSSGTDTDFDEKIVWSSERRNICCAR